MRTQWHKESDPGDERLAQDASLAVHIIGVSAAMVGVCLTGYGRLMLCRRMILSRLA